MFDGVATQRQRYVDCSVRVAAVWRLIHVYTDSKAKAEAFQKQRAAELQAAYEAKMKAQEAAAPKSSKGKKHFFGHH